MRATTAAGPSPDVDSAGYYRVLPAGMGDKAGLAGWMVPGTVLDVGPGDGSVAQVLRDAGLVVRGLDVTPRPGVPDVVAGTAADVAAAYPGQVFDDALMCSVLHEIRSFDGWAGVRAALRSVTAAVRPGGRLVVRDGVRDVHPTDRARVSLPGDWAGMAEVFADVRGTTRVADGHLHGPAPEVVEFLCTGVWGPDLVRRESAETFGWAMSAEVVGAVAQASRWRAGVVTTETWTHPVYRDVWQDAGLELTWVGSGGEERAVDWPHTHGLWVFSL